MARLAGALLMREDVQEGVIERGQAQPLCAGEIEAAGAQVNLVTVAIQMDSCGPLPVPRLSVAQELGPQVPAR
jgi:hypothetical protein